MHLPAVCLALLSLTLVPGLVHGQTSEPSRAPSPVAAAAAYPAARSTASRNAGPAPKRYDQPPVRDSDPMGAVGIGLRTGVALFGNRTFQSALDRALGDAGVDDDLAAAEQYGVDAADLPETADDIQVRSSAAALFALPMNFGGIIFFRLEPLITLGESTNVGGYMGLGGNIHIQRAYISIGIGALGDVMLDDRFELAGDLFVRVPVDVYWYVLDDLGPYLEAAGATGVSVAQPAGAQDVSTATGSLFDFSLGVRFP